MKSNRRIFFIFYLLIFFVIVFYERIVELTYSFLSDEILLPDYCFVDEIETGSSNSWQRDPNPLYYKDPPYFAYPHPPFFFKFWTVPHPITSIPTALFIALFCWLNGWLRHIWCVILLNDIMDLHIRSLGTMYQKDHIVCFMQQGVKFTEVSQNVIFYWYSVLWFDITSTHKISSTHRDQYIVW